MVFDVLLLPSALREVQGAMPLLAAPNAQSVRQGRHALVGASLDAAPSVPLGMSDDVVTNARIGDVGGVFPDVHRPSAPIGECLRVLRVFHVPHVPHPRNGGCLVCPLQNYRTLRLRL